MSAATTARPNTGPRPTTFSHEALLYAGESGFLTGTVPFVREGVENDEAVLVVVATEKIVQMQAALGADAEQVQFADMSDVGHNPARIISAWQDFVAEHGDEGRPLRGIGEPISTSRTPDQLVECQRHESLLNVAFADAAPWRLLCPYDVLALNPVVIEEARRSHPFLLDQGALAPSGDYRGLDASGAPFDVPLPEPPANATSLKIDTATLRHVRVFLGAFARAAGLGDDKTSDLALAAHEIGANTLRYGGGSGVLRTWTDDRAVICEVTDGGNIVAPLAGRERPPATGTSGRGLWLANHLCDLVQIRSTASGGVVRLHQFR
ncbi:MAG: anti-sigma factor RsbA family regulatory protein [Actinomycetes bacterium]